MSQFHYKIKESFMKRIFLTVLLLSSLVSSFLFAVDMKNNSGEFKKDRGDFCHKEMRLAHFSLMKYIHELKLDDGQVSKIKDIMKNIRPKIESYSEVFKDGKFDKDRYIDISLNKYKNMVEYKATLIEKIYEILTKEQKDELKKMIDSNKFEDKKGMKYDKYSNGGR
jgi:Spy/CpxP family protein refolding chaperone